MATITHNNDGTIAVSVTLDLPRGSLLEMEDAILDGVNEVGCLATAEARKRFDTDGSPIIRDGVKWTVRAHDTRKHQTPYGVAEIEAQSIKHQKADASIVHWKTRPAL